MESLRPRRSSRSNVWWCVTPGTAACSVPCGLTKDGLPAGLQIVGPKHADALVLRAARAYESTRTFGMPRL